MQKIENNVRQLTAIIDAIDDPIRVLDKNGKVVFVNRAMKTSLGVKVGDDCFSCFGKEGPCEECLRERVFESGNTVNGECKIGHVTYSRKVSPIPSSEGVIGGTVEVYRDITKAARKQRHLLKENNKYAVDLAMARHIQKSMMNKRLPVEKGWKFSSGFYPCEAIGGDACDCLRLPDGRLLVYVGDVSGHGVRAAMLTVFLNQEAILLSRNPGMTLESLAQQLGEGFRLLNTDESTYITAFFVLIDPASGTCEMMNMGHSIAPLMKLDGRIQEISLPGHPICRWTDLIGGEVRRITLNPGDRILLYSDGISKEGEPQAWVREELKENPFCAEDFIRHARVVQGETPKDDMVILVIERTEKESAE